MNISSAIVKPRRTKTKKGLILGVVFLMSPIVLLSINLCIPLMHLKYWIGGSLPFHFIGVVIMFNYLQSGEEELRAIAAHELLIALLSLDVLCLLPSLFQPIF